MLFPTHVGYDMGYRTSHQGYVDPLPSALHVTLLCSFPRLLLVILTDDFNDVLAKIT